MQISKERNEVEMGKKNSQPYVSENLESLAKDLVYIRGERRNGDYVLIDLEGLKKALSELPKEDREKIERFWGLKGGINHSIKLKKLDFRDKAFVKMSDEAIKSLRTLFRLDFLYMCDRNVAVMVNCLGEKLFRNDENISQEKPRNIEVINGGNDLNISPVSEYIEIEKPKNDKKENIVVPEDKK